MITKSKLIASLPNLVLLVLVILAAVQISGWGLLLLLIVPFQLMVIYRTFNPAWPSSAGPAEKFTEPGKHRVVLQVPGPNSVLVIREIRRTTGLSLLAAKQLVEEAPVVVKEHLSQSSADLVVGQLQKAGARALAAPIGEL